MVDYDMCIKDFALILFLTIKTALYGSTYVRMSTTHVYVHNYDCMRM